MKQRNRTATGYSKTLAVGLMIAFLTACSAAPEMPPKPTTPTNLVRAEMAGMVCYPYADAIRLGEYIIELERGYE